MKRIIVLRGGAIGDFILTLPAVAALRKKFPDARIEMIAHPQIATLAVAAGLVDAVHSIEDRRLASFFSMEGELLPFFPEIFARCDLALSYLFDPDGTFARNFSHVSKACFVTGSHRPDETKKIHATEVYLQPLQTFGISDADPVPRLSLNSEPSTPNFLALHPGSGSERKNWPEEKWSLLLERLVRETNVGVFLIGGEAEGDRLRRLAWKIPPPRLRLAQSLPLVEVAHRLAACSFFVGHDSGISHLAAAVGLPGLILWGETIAEIWRPRSERMKLLRYGRLEGMSEEVVFAELTAAWGGLVRGETSNG